MKKSKFSEEQIATALHQVCAGAPIPEVTRTLGISEATTMSGTNGTGRWRRRRSGACGSFEEENRKLKQRAADLTLDKVILQEVLADHIPVRPSANSRITLAAGHFRPDRCGALRVSSVPYIRISSG